MHAQAREFARAVVQHQRGAGRREGVVTDDIAGIPCADLGDTGIETVIARADSPAWYELINALQVEAILGDRERVADVCSSRVISQIATFLAAEIFALHFEIAFADVAVGRVFPHEIQPGRMAVAAEQIGDGVAAQVGHIRTFAIHRAGAMQRCAGAPALLDADVAADVGEHDACATTVLRPVAAGEATSFANFSAQLNERFGRRQPFELHTVLAQLVLPKCGIDQRLVDEVPGVRVHFVQITQAGKEAAEFKIKTIAQCSRLHESIFNTDATRRVKRQRRHAAKLRVDVGGNAHLRFTEGEALLVPGIGIHGKAGGGQCGILPQAGVSA